MIDLPRSGDEALAQAMDVSPDWARRMRRALGARSDAFSETDQRLKAESALADLTAARTLDAADIAAAAREDDPEGALRATVDRRSDAALQARIAAHVSWSKTEDRSARTRPAREALDAKFLAEAGGDPVRAGHLRKAHYLRLALKSAQARRHRD